MHKTCHIVLVLLLRANHVFLHHLYKVVSFLTFQTHGNNFKKLDSALAFRLLGVQERCEELGWNNNREVDRHMRTPLQSWKQTHTHWFQPLLGRSIRVKRGALCNLSTTRMSRASVRKNREKRDTKSEARDRETWREGKEWKKEREQESHLKPSPFGGLGINHLYPSLSTSSLCSSCCCCVFHPCWGPTHAPLPQPHIGSQ